MTIDPNDRTTTHEPVGSHGVVGDHDHDRHDHERRLPETKTFIATSEFWVFAALAGLLIFISYGLDDIRDATAWKYIVWLAIAYIISRGLAKIASQRHFDRDTGW